MESKNILKYVPVNSIIKDDTSPSMVEFDFYKLELCTSCLIASLTIQFYFGDQGVTTNFLYRTYLATNPRFRGLSGKQFKDNNEYGQSSA